MVTNKKTIFSIILFIIFFAIVFLILKKYPLKTKPQIPSSGEIKFPTLTEEEVKKIVNQELSAPEPTEAQIKEFEKPQKQKEIKKIEEQLTAPSSPNPSLPKETLKNIIIDLSAPSQ
jgi:hypothetical protein